MPLVGERIAAGVAEHVRMRLQFEAETSAGPHRKMKEPPGVSRRLFHQQAKLDSAQILSRGLAVLWIGNNVERDLLAFVEGPHPRALDLLRLADTNSCLPSPAEEGGSS